MRILHEPALLPEPAAGLSYYSSGPTWFNRWLQRGAGLQPAGYGIARQVANLPHAACYLNTGVLEPCLRADTKADTTR